jgi:hypothetical protein
VPAVFCGLLRQLVFLLPQINVDGQWIFWPILDKEMRGCASALSYLKTNHDRYILLGIGNQVRVLYCDPLVTSFVCLCLRLIPMLVAWLAVCLALLLGWLFG